MFFNYLNKRDSASLIIYSQDKVRLSNMTTDILKIIYSVSKEEELTNNPDITEIKLSDLDKLSIGIEEIKTVLPKFQLKPLKSKYKVLVISDAEKLTRDAQGGLLKIVEEPQANSFIILKTTNINSLLATIKSRCDIINLNGERLKIEYDKSILGSDIEEKLKMVNGIILVKDPRQRREEVDKMFSQIFQELNENTLNIQNDKKYKILETVFKYQEYYKSEVNLRLTIENLMITISNILKS